MHRALPRSVFPLLHLSRMACGLSVVLAVAGSVLAQPPANRTTPVAPTEQASKPLLISLDTVLRLAEDQNTKIALAREKIVEAYANQGAAKTCWLPEVYVGPAYYRHEGGIQNEDGTLTRSSTGAVFGGMEFYSHVDLREAIYARVAAHRDLWKQKGEFTRVTNETLLDAASTYIDFLTARTGEAIARDLEQAQKEILKETEDLAKEETGLCFLVEGLRSAAAAHKQRVTELHRQGNAAAAKLSYLLGLGDGLELQPVDGKLLPFDLVDPTPPSSDLVQIALTHGPGIHEMEGLLASIQEGMHKGHSYGRYLPVLETRVLEGGFGAGPGADLAWDNRLDIAIQARWNLTDLVNCGDRARAAQSKLRQVHLTYQDLRAKLSAGVQEARESSLTGKEEIRITADQVKHAQEAYRLAKERFKENVRGSSAAEVLGTLQVLALAQATHLTAINTYDKAQIRLMLLLGPESVESAKKPPTPASPPVTPAVQPASYSPPTPPPSRPAPKAESPANPSPSRQGLDALNDAQNQYKRR